jgi:hypothetical protein
VLKYGIDPSIGISAAGGNVFGLTGGVLKCFIPDGRADGIGIRVFMAKYVDWGWHAYLGKIFCTHSTTSNSWQFTQRKTPAGWLGFEKVNIFR